MTFAAVAIVEGQGEVEALPILLRRLCEWMSPGKTMVVPEPIRVKRDRFLNRTDEFDRYLKLAAAKCGTNGWVLILLDADDFCPAENGCEILERAKKCIPHRRISVVLANREYEAWFIASAHSLNGKRGFRWESNEVVDAERPRNAKGWMKERMESKNYSEIIDQPAFTALMDLQQAHEKSRSFRKLCSEWKKHCA